MVAQKHPSVRARRNNPKAGFTTLAADAREGEIPTWPLPADAKGQATLDLMDDRIAGLTAQIADEEDGRTKGRLRRSLDTQEQQAAILRLQVGQQAGLEAEMWEMLWRTPQAKLWEDSPAFVRTLAQFVRWNVKGEQGDLDAAKEARIRGKEFGLSPLTLMGLKAEIERAAEAEDKGSKRRSTPKAKPKDQGDDDPRSGLYAVN